MLNKLSMEIILSVLKFDKFKIFKFKQSENMPSNDSTLEVSKFNISIDVRDSHPSNI